MPVLAFAKTELALLALEEALIHTHGNLKSACKRIECSILDVQAWMRADPEAAQRVRAAQQNGWAQLENAAYERAVTGIEEPVYQKGLLAGYKTVYSDTLLARMLAARVPGYGDVHTHLHSHQMNVAIMPRASTYEEWQIQRDSQLAASATHAPVGAGAARQEDIEDAEYVALPSPTPGLEDVL